MAKHWIASIVLLLLLCLTILPAGAVVSYEIYTVRPGDTPENLALRQGLQPNEIISIDAGPWQPGKRVALMRKATQAPAPVIATTPIGGANAPEKPRLATVVQSGAKIFSHPGSGEFLFQPDPGSKVIVVAEIPNFYGVMMANQSTGWVEKWALSIVGPLDPNWFSKLFSSGQPAVINEAFRYLGLPYRYGGSLPYNIDCSLFVQRVFAANGYHLPRTAAEQSQIGVAVSYNDIRPGDRLYFDMKSDGRIGHTGIALGNGQFIHASSNRGCVAVDNLAGNYASKLVVVRRF